MNVCALLVLVGLAAALASEDVVHIKSKYSAPPLITSSTLRWVKKSIGERSEAAVVGAYEIVPGDNTNGEDEENLNEVLQRDVYVCRARHNGEWLAGVLRSGHPACHVALGNHVFRYNDYEVLDNEDKAARLSWERWDRFTGTMPVGAVAAGDNYIARRKVEEPGDGRAVLGFTHLLGQIEKRGFQGLINVVDQNDKAAEFQDGEVLVETEPIRYELTVTTFNNKRQKIKRQARVLGQSTLRNGGGEYTVNVDSAMAYDSNYSLYYGQGRAILKGLPTKVRLPQGPPHALHGPSPLYENIKWGIPEVEERKEVHRIEARLAPGTAVNVTLVGNYTDNETPYTGKLVAVYPDGETRARTIGGSRRQMAMLDVHAELGPVYFLSNDSLVPTTTTTTTTTTSTTTTTTTTTTTSTTTEEPSTPAHTKKPKKTLPGESEGAGHKGENSSMMSDEGDQDAPPQREAVISESSTAPPSAAATALLTLALPCLLLQALRIA